MSNNPSNKNHSFIGRFGILFLQLILLTVLAVVVSCGSDSAGTAPASTSGGTSGGTTLVVGDLTLDGVSADSVTVSWDALLNVEGVQEAGMTYQVSAWKSGAATANANNVVNSDPSRFRYSSSLSGLSSNTAYQITIEARDSMGKSMAKSSLWAVPSGKAFSGLAVGNKLAAISEAKNVTDTEMEVTWDEASSAVVYAVIAAEDQSDLIGELEEVKKDKKIKIVCKSDLSGSECPEFSKNADSKITIRVSDLISGKSYTAMVLPLTFQDLAGLKMSDEERKEIAFVDAVKALLEKKDSIAFNQTKDVVDAIESNNQAVIDKIRVLSMASGEVGQAGNLTAVNYDGEVHVSWEHAAGANRYEAVLTTNSGKATNTVDRKYAAQFSGGRSVFSNVGVGSYTVSVLPYFENSSGVKVREGKAVQISGERKAGDPVFTPPNQVIGLKFTNHAPGAMTLSWSTKETAALSKYYIYYYQGTTEPDLPNYQANKGETNNLVIENIKPGSYTLRVDAVADGVVIGGIAISEDIYTTPEPPRLVTPWPAVITNIGGKLYHTAYGYTVLEGNPGGPTNNSIRTSVTASYRVGSEEWQDTALISGRAVFGADEADVVSSYGKGYEVKVTVKNPGGFESSTTKSFVFRSFPEPIKGSKVTITPDDRRLLVTWPESENTHSSKVAFYTVVVTDGDVLDLSASVYGMTNVIGRSVVLDNLTNGKLYTVNVFPVSSEGWSLLSALGQKYNYPNIAATDINAVTGIFGSYVGFPAQARPIGKPELVIGLTVKATNRSATDGAVEITWEASTNGSPADNYVVEYLKDVKPVLVIGNNNTVAVTGLDWSQALSMTVNANSNPSNRSYAAGITGLNTTGATNVFRVKAVNGKGNRGYEHYVLGTDASTPPAAPGPITLVSADENFIVLSWLTNSAGNDKNGNKLELLRYSLQYSTDNAAWTDLTDTGVGVKLTVALTNNTNITVIGLTGGTTYYFRVAGINAVGRGDFSSVLTVDYTLVTSIMLAPAPLNLEISSNAVVTATLSPANALNTYLITNLTWTSSDTNVVTVSDNKKGSATVTAVHGGVAKVWSVAGNISNSVTVTVTPVSPANFRQIAYNTTTAALAWDPSPGTGTYHLSQIMDDGTINSPSSLTGTTYTVSGLTANTYYRYQLKACADDNCSSPASLLALTVSGGNDLAAIIAAKAIPANLSGYDQSAQDIFSNYTANTAIVPRYVTAGGSGNKTGTAWSNAAGSLKTVLEAINDASVDKVYAVLLGPGVYDAGAGVAMKNHVTIAGGISPLNTVPVNAAAIGPTVLSGNNSHGVFYNNYTYLNRLNSTARLYGVTIADGKLNNGGGMYNVYSSPVLTEVIFSNNTATRFGGGMYSIYFSSPALSRVVFSGNTADGGGGMYNESSGSSPVLTGVIFSGNTATRLGGGMYNYKSSPILTKVIFSGNTAKYGGGMANHSSSPVLTGVVFSGNMADIGGGMYNKSSSSSILTGVVFSGNMADIGGGMYNKSSSPTAVNTIFWGESVSNIDGGSISFYYSVVEGGNSDTTNNIVTTNPGLLSLADNGGGIQTMAIPTTSSAKDKGIHVKRKGSTHYYSIDKNSWYTTPKLDNAGAASVTLPTDAIDLTATDMRGEPVQGRPDIGVYEVQ